MPNEPVWTTPEEVVAINRDLLAGTGEPHILRDLGLLEGACQRPYNHWAFGGVDDIVSLAAALLFGIAHDHPFVQGNKRTAFAAMTFFLEDNGFALTTRDDPSWADELVAVLEGGTERASLEEGLRRVAVATG